MKKASFVTLKILSHRFFLLLVIILPIMLFLTFGCEEKIEQPGSVTGFSEKQTCVGCHTDEEALKALATPEPPPPSDGGG